MRVSNLYASAMTIKSAMLWHPHQKLWNWDLVDRVRGSRFRLLADWIIPVDSFLLATRAILRRLHALKVGAVRRVPKDSAIRVLYLDCGVHTEGKQIRLMHEWFAPLVNLQMIGFEASPRHFPEALRNLSDIPNLELRHVALVAPDHSEETIRLYRTGGDGKGDSVFPERGTEYDEVAVARLSNVIRGVESDVIVILRMNIEGAEWHVVEDLVAAGMRNRIGAFYGMWDDLSKIDWSRDDIFRDLLRRNGIRPLTFNDRDLAHPLRRWAIRLDLDTSIQAGHARIR